MLPRRNHQSSLKSGFQLHDKAQPANGLPGIRLFRQYGVGLVPFGQFSRSRPRSAEGRWPNPGRCCGRRKLGRHHASPVLVGGRVFFINDDGQVNVVNPGPTFERVGQYALGEPCYASPAISDGPVFLRGFKNLFCIGRKTKS
jgi:hypothetical protein